MSLTVGRNTASSPIPHHLPLSLLPPLFPSRLPFPSMPTFLDHLLNATPHSPLALLYIHRFLLLFLLFLLFLLLLLLLLTYLPLYISHCSSSSNSSCFPSPLPPISIPPLSFFPAINVLSATRAGTLHQSAFYMEMS